MYKANIYKIILGLLFAAAITLGLLRSNQPSPEQRQLKSQGVSDGSLESYIKRGQELAKPQNTETKVTFLAVGDIMLSRNVALKTKESDDNFLPFRGMENILKSTHFNFANLESPLVEKNSIVGGHSMIFAAPTSSLLGLIDNNFIILNLANNHALDKGLGGLNSTIKALDSIGIKHIGTGSTTQDAWQPAVVDTNGIKVCFVGASYASINDSGKTRNEYVARIEDLDQLKANIYNLKASCDFTVVTMHAGTEYTRKPNKAQTTFARAAIDYGADIVIGAHPHWVQTIERYCPGSPPLPLGEDVAMQRATGEGAPCASPKYIFYSLGNFIFDQEWSPETKEGLTLKITLTKNSSCSVPIYGRTLGADESARYSCGNDLQGPKTSAVLKQIELLPVIIENYSTPRPATDDEAKKILQKIGEKENILY